MRANQPQTTSFFIRPFYKFLYPSKLWDKGFLTNTWQLFSYGTTTHNKKPHKIIDYP